MQKALSNGAETMAKLSGISFACLLYTSDAADDLLCVDLGGRRIIKKKKLQMLSQSHNIQQQ